MLHMSHSSCLCTLSPLPTALNTSENIFLLAMVGYNLYSSASGQLDYAINILLSIVLITLTILLILLFVLMSVRNIK